MDVWSDSNYHKLSYYFNFPIKIIVFFIKYTSILEVVEILLFVDLGDYKFYVELTSINIYKFLYFYIYLYLIGAYHTYFMPIIEPHLIIDFKIIYWDKLI